MINFFPQTLTSSLQQTLRLFQPGGQSVEVVESWVSMSSLAPVIFQSNRTVEHQMCR
jgi:hypothetical protein